MAKKKRPPQPKRPAAPGDDQPQLTAEQRAARRAEQKQEWARQRQGVERAAGRSFAPLIWAGGVITTLVVVAVLGLLIFSGGGSVSSVTPTKAVALADPRVAGQAPVATYTIAANDNGQNVNPRWEPNTLAAKAGQVFEIDVNNIGSVFHNLTVAGLDGTYGTSDDWNSVPLSIPAGGTAKLVARFDVPGTYKFECNLHAGIQIGTLTVVPSATTSGSATVTASASPAPTPAP